MFQLIVLESLLGHNLSDIVQSTHHMQRLSEILLRPSFVDIQVLCYWNPLNNLLDLDNQMDHK